MREKFKKFWKFLEEYGDLIFWTAILSPIWIPLGIILILIICIQNKINPPKIAGICPKCGKDLFYGNDVCLLPIKPEEIDSLPEKTMYFSKKSNLCKVIICVECKEKKSSKVFFSGDGLLKEPQTFVSNYNYLFKEYQNFLLKSNN